VAGGDASGRATLSIATPNGLAMMIDLRYGLPFAFPYAAPGTYHLEAVDKNAGLEVRRTVRVADSDIDITLTPAAPLSLSGSVRVDGGGPAAATVRLVADDTAYNAQAAAKADGTFVIPNVQPTIYTVQVDAGPGTYLKSIRFGEHTLTALQIDLARTSGPLIVTLGSDGGTLAGHVAVDDATVILVRKSPDLTRFTTARDGRFEFRDIAPGDYTVFAWSDGESGLAIPVHIAAKQSAAVDLRQ